MKVESNEVNENGPSSAAAGDQLNKTMPKDAQVMASMLRDMGINEWEPRVLNQLLEFSYNYVTTILDDAKMLSGHARKKNIDVEDVRLAVQMYSDKNVTCPPHRDLLLEVARSKNASTLPIPKPNSGLRLPPDRFCLNACNFKLKSNKRLPRSGPYYYGGPTGASSANAPPGSGTATTMIYNKQTKQIMVAPTPGSQQGVQQSFTMTPAGLVANPRQAMVKAVVSSGQNKVQIQPNSGNSGPQVFTMTINPNSAGIKRES